MVNLDNFKIMVDTPDLSDYPSKKEKLKEKYQDVHNRGYFSYLSYYITSLFPILNWIRHYNLTWLSGDLIAGLTVGAVLIPEGMSYAVLVGLSPEFGLYSSFVGVTLYFLFSTSKDVTIGPTTVMSLLLAQSLASIKATYGDAAYDPVTLVVALSFICGWIAFAIGILRLGFIVNFISTPIIAGFTTGSAITISISQIHNVLGESGPSSTDPAYLTLGKTLKYLPNAKIDAAIGLVALVYLYTLKYGSRYLTKRYPSKERFFFFIEISRNISVVIIAALVAYLVGRSQPKNPFKILKDVPTGFKHMGVPTINTSVISQISSNIPGVVLIMVLEHVAIAKSFGRINNYKIVPSQELIAIGVTNIVGSFFGAYPSTGSFSRTAINAKSGVKTPLGGIFSSLLVVLALYVFTPAFYYIPDAVLSAIIMHVVLNLISSPSYVIQLWQIQFWDFLVFAMGVTFTFFFTVEVGIYASVAVSILVLLLRLSHPRYEALGRLKLKRTSEYASSDANPYAYAPLNSKAFKEVVPPPDGVLIFRINESLIYPNAPYIDDKIIDYAKSKTKRVYKLPTKKGDRLWNEPNCKDINQQEIENSMKPVLKAVVFDFVTISYLDSTGLQALIDIKHELNKYSGRNVEYHFSNILSNTIKKSLIVAGFRASGEVEEDHITVTDNDSDSKASDKNIETAELHQQSDAQVAVVVDKAKSNDSSDKGTIGKESEDNNTIITIDNHISSIKRRKNFFHLTLQEAISTATNGVW